MKNKLSKINTEIEAALFAYSPDIEELKEGLNIEAGSALYVISCDFTGSDLEYNRANLEAAKDYLEQLNIPYKVLFCDALPRHNWKRYVRAKEVSLVQYEAILSEHQNDGQKAAQAFFQLIQHAPQRSTTISEEKLENFVTKITILANMKRLLLCEEIFSSENILRWSSSLKILSREYEKYQEALIRCEKAIIESAKKDGCREDNIAYKQEELVVYLYFTDLMKEKHKSVIAFYNRFSAFKDQTGHMKACEQFGFTPIFDLRFRDKAAVEKAELFYIMNGVENNLVVARKDVSSSSKIEPENQDNEIKNNNNTANKNRAETNDEQKQLESHHQRYLRLQPSLQLNFILEILEQVKNTMPAYQKFIDSSIRLYNKLGSEQQLKFITQLLEQPKRMISNYHDFFAKFDKYLAHMFKTQTLTNDISEQIDSSLNSWDPQKLFHFQEEMRNNILTISKLEDKQKKTPLHCLSTFENPLFAPLLCGAETILFMISIIISVGGNLNAMDSLLNTPLCLAMLNGCANIGNALLKAGARGDISNYCANTPLYYARDRLKRLSDGRMNEIVSVLNVAEEQKNRLYKIASKSLNLSKEVYIYYRFFVKFDQLYTHTLDMVLKTNQYVERIKDSLASNKSHEFESLKDEMKNDILFISKKEWEHSQDNATHRKEYRYNLIHLLGQKDPDYCHVANRNVEAKLIMLNALVLAGADLDVRDSDGQTPLHIAIFFVNTSIAKALLEAGARYDIKDNSGRIAPDYFDSWPYNKRITTEINKKEILDVLNSVPVISRQIDKFLKPRLF